MSASSVGTSPVGTRRVLELLGPSTGGIRRHVAALAEGLPTHGWDAVTAGPAGVLDGLGGIEHVVAVPGPGPGLLRAARSLRNVVEASDVSVVHAHGLKAGWLAVLARAPIPTVVTVHNLVLDEVAGRASRPLRLLESRLPARAAATIAVSEAIARRFDGVGGAERVRVIRPVGPPPSIGRTAAKVRDGLGVAARTPLIVSLARLHPQKDLPTLLRAMADLAVTLPEAVLVIAGEGPDEADLRALAASLGLDEAVRFAPPTDDPGGLLAAADVVVVSSSWESGPLVVAEALELGRPVISTPVGFVPELVGSEGTAGRLVEVGDARGMAAAIAEVLADPAAAAAMGAAGRSHVLAHLDRDSLLGEVASVLDGVAR